MGWTTSTGRKWSVTGLYSFVAMLMMTGSHRKISGYYLATEKNAVAWLQVVR
jgi:hypothetical protein